jgi:hypothetical protein
VRLLQHPRSKVHKQKTLNLQNNNQESLDLGIQIRDTDYNFNIEILERFQLKALRMITNAPWFEPNAVYIKGSSDARS